MGDLRRLERHGPHVGFVDSSWQHAECIFWICKISAKNIPEDATGNWPAYDKQLSRRLDPARSSIER